MTYHNVFLWSYAVMVWLKIKRRGKHSHGPFPPGWPIFKLHSATQF